MKFKSEMKFKRHYKAFQAISILALFFFAIMVSTNLAQRITPKTAQASTNQTTAFSLDSLTEFQDYLNDGTDENGFRLSAFNATFNADMEDDKNAIVLYKKNGKTINLAERCVKDEPKTPYRYWFFVKSNKLKKPGSMYWQTVGFTGTTKKTNNTATPANMNYVSIKYIQADTHQDSFFKSDGKDLSSGGESYGLSLYVIDIKDWFLATVDDYDNYTDELYLQSITQIFSPNGTAVTKKFTNCTEWKAAANKYGFASSGIATYPQHYNMKLDVCNREIHKTYIHRIKATEDYPIKGENSDSDFDTNGTDGKKVYEINAESSFTISGANTYKRKEKTYYLKGIRITDENEKTGEVKEAAHFYILDNPFSSKAVKITGTDGIKSNNYSKKSGTGTGKNTIGKDRYCRDQNAQIKLKKNGGYTIKSGNKNATNAKKIENDYLTGKKTWDEITDYMLGQTYKSTYYNTHIYLIYSTADPAVTFTASYWSSDASAGSKDTNEAAQAPYQKTEDAALLYNVNTKKLQTDLDDKACGKLDLSKYLNTINQQGNAVSIKGAKAYKSGSSTDATSVKYTLKKVRLKYYPAKANHGA